jgi:hypothetical protein
LWATLEALRAAQHSVLEIRPTLTLEDVFFRYVDSASVVQPTLPSAKPNET